MKQIVRTYWGDFPQRDLCADMDAHPNWSIHTMAGLPAKDEFHSNQLIVVFNEDDNVLTVPEPIDVEKTPWDWKKKAPKVGDWPPGPTPTCKGE